MKKRFFCVILVLFMLLFSMPLVSASAQSGPNAQGPVHPASDPGNSQCGSIYTIDDPYEYPILPGTKEWLELDSLQSKIDACRIDPALLESMTTPALAETVLRYPLLVNMCAYNTPLEGLSSVAEYFEGIDVLAQREDAVEYLQGLEQRNTYSDDGVLTPLYARVLTSYSQAAQGNVSPVSQTTASPNAAAHPPLRTPNGTVLTEGADAEYMYDLTWNDHGFTESDAEEAQTEYKTTYPHATLVAPYSPKYNCHSYAWHSTSTTNKYWINKPNRYMTDGSYARLTTPIVGCKVYWTNSTHSAIVQNLGGGINNPTVRSKWGCLGVYTHSANDCPYSGNLSYWD